jgi:hypothetical protein
LVEASGWRRWPPPLPQQPIFYPVLNEEYATMIARDWNVKHSGAGYVTRFEVRRDFLDGYQVHQVGGQTIPRILDTCRRPERAQRQHRRHNRRDRRIPVARNATLSAA